MKYLPIKSTLDNASTAAMCMNCAINSAFFYVMLRFVSPIRNLAGNADPLNLALLSFGAQVIQRFVMREWGDSFSSGGGDCSKTGSC